MTSDKGSRSMLVSGAEYGGPLASKIVGRHLSELQRLSETAINNIEPAAAVTISIQYRVDGTISYWRQEGVDRVRFTKRGQTVHVEAMVPEWQWKGKTALELRQYLAQLMDEVLSRSLQRIEKERIPFPATAVLHVWDAAKAEYLDPDTIDRVSPLEWKDPTGHIERALEGLVKSSFGKTEDAEPIRRALDELKDLKVQKRDGS